jgi:menaquinone-dependent protoporphyrinogen IX oxidase
MNRILIAYATMAGSTVEVAQAVGEEIAKSGCQVDVLPISEINGIEAYDGVVVGGPMIMGWHRAARRFLRKHREAFEDIPLAVFVMAMSLTQSGETSVGGLPIYVDEELPKPPKNEERLNFRERYARLSNYRPPVQSNR